MSEENGVVRSELTGPAVALVSALSARSSIIAWAGDATNLYKQIERVYSVYHTASAPPDQVTALVTKVQELEQNVTVDLERHIGVKNGRAPYYTHRVLSLLMRAEDMLKGCVSNGKYACTTRTVRDMDHLAAELQTTFTEYGFCQVLDAIYDIDEATQKLEALSLKLNKVEGTLTSGPDHSLALVELHDVIATQNGIQQAMTEANIERIKSKFSQIDQRITKLENNISSSSINSESEFFMHYLACQHLLGNKFVKSIWECDTADVVNSHMIHPGTRGWILEAVNRWFSRTQKRIYVIGGREGTGKTALSSAICKLYSHNTVASHFFDRSKGGNVQQNQLNFMLQSLASDLCKTVPEYINWMDDKYSNTDLSSKLAESWMTTYNILFKEPFQALYGVGSKSAQTLKRKLIVIDGADQLSQSEWPDFKKCLGMFCKDLSSSLCVFVTIHTDDMGKLLPPDDDGEILDGIKFEDRAWINWHIKDIEIYLSGSLGAILSGEDEVDTPFRAKADESTLQKTVDELLKSSGGRFDYAIELMESFAAEMIRSSGQFLSSLKKGLTPVQQKFGPGMEEQMRDFASPYRAYRDSEGRSVRVRVMRQNHYLMDKTRVALIRGRHKVL